MWYIWDATHPDDATRAKLQDVPAGYDLILEGDGDIWRITATPQSGPRTFDYDSESDTIDDESFQSYPMSWRIEQMGAAPNKVALTFDDGPDPEWTPKILDVLKQKKAPGTFFVIGESANQYENIVKREYALGNEIGNHTFTHPEFDNISKTELQIQLNLTELLLESSLGVKTTLFRPPYGIDHQPETASEVQMLPIPQSMGYVIIGARIDPHDWGEANGGPPPPANTIVQRVLADVEANKGNIILMHDGGGDRSHTVAALPQIIDGLRAKGYEFVSVSESARPESRAGDAAADAPGMVAGARGRLHFRHVPLAARRDRVHLHRRHPARQRPRAYHRPAGADRKAAPRAAGPSGIPAGGYRADSRVQRGSRDRRHGRRGARFQLSEPRSPGRG